MKHWFGRVERRFCRRFGRGPLLWGRLGIRLRRWRMETHRFSDSSMKIGQLSDFGILDHWPGSSSRFHCLVNLSLDLAIHVRCREKPQKGRSQGARGGVGSGEHCQHCFGGTLLVGQAVGDKSVNEVVALGGAVLKPALHQPIRGGSHVVKPPPPDSESSGDSILATKGFCNSLVMPNARPMTQMRSPLF